MGKDNKNKKVFVGLSGGVDSSVAALLLKEEGYDVHGVFIKIWYPEGLQCNWQDEQRDAMQVAAHLGIPFHTLDLSDVYRRAVIEYLLDEYKAGRTPNPDVMCNRHVKFGAFLNWAREQGADYVATGHYARKGERGELLRGVDDNKDQSYFLWTLTAERLARILFPVGAYTKPQVRTVARAHGLHTATKRDSQGLCFVGPISMQDFLKTHIAHAPGALLAPDGSVVGEHDGAQLYTIGQRRGFRARVASPHAAPSYVVEKDVAANTVTVAPVSAAPRTRKCAAELRDAHFIGARPEAGAELHARIRHRGALHACTVTAVDSATSALTLSALPERPAAGQSVVLYDGERCLGGGVAV